MQHVGRPQTVTIAGRPVRLGRLTRGVLRQWTDWARTLLPNVLAAVLAHFDHFPPKVQKLLADAAIANAEARKDFGSEELSRLWYSRPGTAQLLGLLIVEGSSLDLDLAVDLASQAVDELGDETVAKWISTASGRVVASQFELETRAYTEAGFLPSFPPSRNKREWHEIDRDIFQNIGLTPQQVDEMTLPELIAVLRAEDKAASMADAFKRAEMYHKLTPAQRLKLAVWSAEG